MSSTGEILGGAVGLVAGSFAGAPLQGLAIGSSVGRALDPPPGPHTEGPRLDDATGQTSSYGDGVGTIDGTSTTPARVIWVEGGKRKEVAVKSESDSKGGGGGATSTTYEVYVTCCILLADHPVDGIGRLWFGPNLVSNGLSEELETAAASGELFPTLHLHTDTGLLKASLGNNPKSGTVRLYPGFDDQPCDPRMEADLGVGKCPAYRGWTTLYLYDFPLKEYNNVIAGLQVKPELIRGGSENSAVLLRSDTTSRLNSASEISAVANYVYPDETIVLTPTWLAVPGVDTFPLKRLNYGLSGPTRDGFYAVASDSSLPQEDGEGPGWVQRGITDDPDFYTTGAFAGTLGLIGNFVGFTDAGGRFAAKGDEYAGTIWAPARGIYRWSGKNVSAAITYDPGISTVDVTLDDSLYTYALLSSGIIKKYDSSLTEVDSKTLTFEADSGVDYSLADNFIHWDSGVVYFIFGRQARYIHAMPDDFSSNPSYLCDVGVSPHGETATSELLAITAATVKDGILTRFTVAQADQDTAVDRWLLPTLNTTGEALPAVVRRRIEKSKHIRPQDLNVSLLTGTVDGYTTSGINSIRSTVQPLMAAYGFDIIPSGYQLKCVPRGQAPVMTIDYDDLDARPFGSEPGPALVSQREMDAQLPRQVVVGFLDPGRNYNKNSEASDPIISLQSVNVETFELPLSFTPNNAAGIAQTLGRRKIIERLSLKGSLPQTYLALEAADVIKVPAPEGTYELFLQSAVHTVDNRLEFEAVPNDDAVYTPNAVGGDRVLGDTTVPFAGKTVMRLLDIPLIRDQDNIPGFAGALSGKSASWPGGVVVRSVDSGQTWQPLQGYSNPVTMGVCRNSLPVHDGLTIDRVNTLTVDLNNTGMSLSSITQEQMMTGKHWFAYGVHGRWEIGRFVNAVFVEGATYTIDTIARGLRGTEWATGLHEDGDDFIFLSDSDAAFLATNVSDIGVERLYRGITNNKGLSSAADTPFIYTGENLRTPSPVHLKGSIDGSYNWNLLWSRRSRLSNNWWVTGVQPPVGEASEAYEIEIMNGASVARVLTASDSTVQYTAAQQIEDFASLQTTLTYRVYQMSDIVGRGRVAEITIAA
jgi:hypothetical protein